MPSMEAFTARLLPPVNYSQLQKVVRKLNTRKKMLISYVQSLDVYENKGNTDKMPGEEADIFGDWPHNEATVRPERARKDGQFRPKGPQVTRLLMCVKSRERAVGKRALATGRPAMPEENMARKEAKAQSRTPTSTQNAGAENTPVTRYPEKLLKTPGESRGVRLRKCIIALQCAAG